MISKRLSMSDNLKIIFLVIVFVFFTKGFNMLGWDLMVPLRYYAIVNIFIILYYLFLRQSINNNQQFAKYAHFTIIWGIVVILYTNFCGGSSYYELRKCYPLVGIFFFIYSKYKFSEKVIIRSITIIALITAVIQIYEQFYPELAIFGVNDPNAENYYGEIAGKRNDLYRLWVGCQSTQLFCFSYYTYIFFNKKKITPLFLSILFAVSLYLYLTRQTIIVASLCILLLFLFNKVKSAKISSFIIIVGLIGGILYYWDDLFKAFVEDYKVDTYTTDIRWKCMGFMFDHYISNPITAIIGHGHHPVEQLWAFKHSYYMGDIGIVGDGLFYYGLVWGFSYLYIVYLYFVKLKSLVPPYLTAFVLATFFGSLFGFPFYDRPSMLVWISIIYISSNYIYINNIKKYERRDEFERLT